jgi:hypothetical protein
LLLDVVLQLMLLPPDARPGAQVLPFHLLT